MKRIKGYLIFVTQEPTIGILIVVTHESTLKKEKKQFMHMDKLRKPLEERNVLLPHTNQQQEREEINCRK